MDFSFTEEQTMIAETAQAFFADNATSERTRAAMAGDGMDHALWTGYCQELGFGGLTVSEDNGGAGLGHVELAVVAESAGAQVAAMPLLGLASVAAALEAGGSQAQRAEWLGGLLEGAIVPAAALDAKLHANGDAVSGILPYVPHGANASVLLVAQGDDAWLVNLKQSGVSVAGKTTMDQTRPFAEITLDHASATRLVEGNESAAVAARQAALICLAAEALGGAQACLDRTVTYSQERIQFGRQIGSFQAYKHRLADMMVAIEQARSAAYWAACAVDEKTDDMALALHAAKVFCGDTFFKAASDMIQLHGGIGFTWEHDAHLYFKRAKAIQEMNNNTRWHREEVAKLILGDAA